MLLDAPCEVRPHLSKDRVDRQNSGIPTGSVVNLARLIGDPRAGVRKPSRCKDFELPSSGGALDVLSPVDLEGVSSSIVTPPALTLAGVAMPKGDMETLGQIPP